MNAPQRRQTGFTICFTLLVAACVLLALWVCLLPAQASVVTYPSEQSQLDYTSAPLTSPTPCGQGSWEIVSSPSYNARDHRLQDISSTSANDAWAIGDYSTVGYDVEPLFEHWDGAKWSLVPSPSTSGNGSMHGVSAASSDDVWAVGGQGGSSLSMHWDGDDWEIVSTPNVSTTSEVLFDVSALATDDAWAVGRIGSNLPGAPLILHWDGTNWSNSSTSPGAVPENNPSALFGVSAVSHDDVWAVGSRVAPTSTTHPLLMHYIGGQWNQLPTLEEFGELWSVTAISANDVWAVGYHYDNSQLRAITRTIHWDGQSWSIIPSPNLPSPYACFLTSVVARSSNDVWAVGRYSKLGSAVSYFSYTLVMHWDGSKWTIVDSPNAGTIDFTWLTSVAVVGEDLFSVGYYGTADSYPALIERYHADPCLATSTPIPPTANPTTTTAPPTATPPPAPTNTLVSPSSTAPPTTTNTALPGSTPTACLVLFSDVPSTHTFYPYVQCLACLGILGGYDDGTFRPDSLITRGQIAKVVSNAADLTQDPGAQMYEDIPASNPFYIWVNRLSSQGYMGGYSCGADGEPCGTNNLPYFRPYGNATRGQIAKIVSNVLGLNDDPGNQIYDDVPSTNPFFLWIQRVTHHYIMSGYDCGGPGEPCTCDLGDCAYFRSFSNATRGQTAKTISRGFFPECAP